MKAPESLFGERHAIACELASETLRSSGTLRLGVSGWSMLPTLWPGDTLVVQRAGSDEIAEGDIVLFARDRRFFVHRVIRKDRSALMVQTRGDALPRPDPPVSNRELLGRVVSVERNGEFLQPNRNFTMVDRSVTALVRHSNSAARVAVVLHRMAQSL